MYQLSCYIDHASQPNDVLYRGFIAYYGPRVSTLIHIWQVRWTGQVVMAA